MAANILAKALQPNATIGFVSLSARLNHIFPAAVERAQALFETHGYKVKVFYTPAADDAGIQSGIADRLAELRSALTDPTVSAIVCTIGGECFTELLPSLVADTDLQAHVRANPKIIVGYSDNTGLHWFLNATTGLRTFYGPTAIPELGTSDSLEDEASPLVFCARSLFSVITKAEALGRSLMPQITPSFSKTPSLRKCKSWHRHRRGSGCAGERPKAGSLAAFYLPLRG